MKTVVYKGKSCELGRFGKVRKGDILQLTHAEASYVANDPQFVVKVSAETEGPLVVLRGARIYDLRTIPWGEPGLDKWFVRRTQSELWKIMLALEEIGISVPEHIKAAPSKELLVDFFMDTCDAHGWFSLTLDQRAVLDSVETWEAPAAKVSVTPEDSESDEKTDEDEKADEDDEETPPVETKAQRKARLKAELKAEREAAARGESEDSTAGDSVDSSATP